MTGPRPEPRTHTQIDRRLVGEPLELGPGSARVALTALAEMAADERGLVHGGFLFGLADYAAMLAVNDPRVVLGSAEVRFARPVRVGERVVAEARVVEESGRKRVVEVTARRDGESEPLLTARCVCLVPDRHVLEPAT